MARLLALLAGKPGPRAHRGLRALRPGRVRAALTGGNLSLLAHSIGTPFQVAARGRILFVEEIGEAPYRIDRMVRQLLLAGVFRDVAGVVLGQFSGIRPAERRAVAGLFLEALGERAVPVVAGLPAGHDSPNRAFPFGVPATLDADAGTLVFDPCVRRRMKPGTGCSARSAGQLLVAGFDGTEPSQEILALIRAGLGGVILYRKNCVDAAQVLELTNRLQEAARAAGHAQPLLIAIDQEQGRVVRITEGVTVFPAMGALARVGDPELIQRVAAATSRELLAIGVNWNLAPVADVLSVPDCPVGDRSFGTDPAQVARAVAAFVRGAAAAGMRTCAKHFPGHGATEKDSHVAAPRVARSRAELDACDLVPFRAAIAGRRPRGDDRAHHLPGARPGRAGLAVGARSSAACCAAQLGFAGVVVSDDLEMAGIALEPHAGVLRPRGAARRLGPADRLAHAAGRALHPRPARRPAARDPGGDRRRRRPSPPRSSASAASRGPRLARRPGRGPRRAARAPTTWPCSRRSNAVPSAEALAWARRAFPGLDPVSARPLPPAGSSRALTRLLHTGGSLVLVENPRGDHRRRQRERRLRLPRGAPRRARDPGARGAGLQALARLVARRGPRRPGPLRRGARRLPRAGGGRRTAEARERVAALYREALDVLVRLQVDCVAGFDPRRTHNPPRYDVALMREGESGYFVRELLGRPPRPGRAGRAGRRARPARRAGRRGRGRAICSTATTSRRTSRSISAASASSTSRGRGSGRRSTTWPRCCSTPTPICRRSCARELLEHYLELFTSRTREDRERFPRALPARRRAPADAGPRRLRLPRAAARQAGVPRAHPDGAAPARGDARPARGSASRCSPPLVAEARRAGGAPARRAGGAPERGRMSPAAAPPRAMVLAAGLGTRLRPLTNAIPKPLVPIANRPLLEYTFALLAGAGVREAIVNTHHLPDDLRGGAARPRRRRG